MFLGSLELRLAFGLVFAPMIVEAMIAGRHERALRACGAIEPEADVYKVVQLAYPGCFLVLLAEGALRGVRWDAVMAAGTAIFAAAKALNAQAIASPAAMDIFACSSRRDPGYTARTLSLDQPSQLRRGRRRARRRRDRDARRRFGRPGDRRLHLSDVAARRDRGQGARAKVESAGR